MELRDLLPAAMLVVVAGVGISIGAEVTTDTAAQFNSNCTQDYGGCRANAASANATDGLAELGDWFDTLGLVIAAAVVLGVLMTAFYFRNR